MSIRISRMLLEDALECLQRFADTGDDRAAELVQALGLLKNDKLQGHIESDMTLHELRQERQGNG